MRWNECPCLATRPVHCHYKLLSFKVSITVHVHGLHIYTSCIRCHWHFPYVRPIYLYGCYQSCLGITQSLAVMCFWSLCSCLPSSYSTNAVDCRVCRLRRRSSRHETIRKHHHQLLHVWIYRLMGHQLQYSRPLYQLNTIIDEISPIKKQG